MFEHITPILETIADVVDLLGVVILILAALRFLLHYAIFEFSRMRGRESVFKIRDMRIGLGSYILLALEFMIIADVVHSALSRTMEDFLLLGLIVLIRTVLSFFLGLEVKEMKEAPT